MEGVKFKNYLISDVFFYQEGPGVRKWQFRDSGVKLLNVGNINNGQINLSSTSIYLSEEEAYGKYSHFLINEGDLLIACSGILVDNFHNKIAFAKKEMLPLCLNTSTMRFKELPDKKGTLNYLKYFLQTNKFKGQLVKLITGSAQLNFGPSHIRQIEIALPDLATQQKIAAVLGKADELRQYNKQLIEKYDALTQSLFLDMFGDIDSNPKQWIKKSFDYFALFDTKMTNDFIKYADVPHIGIANIEKDTGKLIDYKSVKDENLKSGKYIFNSEHIIYSKIRPNLNKVALPEFEGLCSADSYPIKVLKNNTNRIFFAYILRSQSFLNFILAHSTRTNIPKANKEQMKKFYAIAPPVILQNQFAERVQLIEQQKELAQQALQKSEELFNSLLQKAFKGELILEGLLTAHSV